jgi:hypothetical protein
MLGFQQEANSLILPAAGGNALCEKATIVLRCGNKMLRGWTAKCVVQHTTPLADSIGANYLVQEPVPVSISVVVDCRDHRGSRKPYNELTGVKKIVE